MSLRTRSECAHAFGNAATATIAMVPAVPGQRVAIYRFMLTNGATAVAVTIQDTTGAALSQAMNLGANQLPLWLETQSNGDFWWITNPGVGVQLGHSGTVNLSFDIWYQYVT